MTTSRYVHEVYSSRCCGCFSSLSFMQLGVAGDAIVVAKVAALMYTVVLLVRVERC